MCLNIYVCGVCAHVCVIAGMYIKDSVCAHGDLQLEMMMDS